MEIGNVTFGPYTFNDTIPTSNVKWELIKEIVKVKIWNKGDQPDPEYAKPGDAGMDIRANEACKIYPGETQLVKTGIHVGLPEGYEIQVRPRSGQSLKTKIRVANSPGTIDHGYTGEICIICDNIGSDPYEVKEGDRIAQIILKEVPSISWQKVNNEAELGETSRGSGGFGSTGHN